MTLEQDNTIEASLCKLFPTAYLREQAEKTGVIQRDRKVDPVALFWTLVLGFGIGKDRTIASLRRGYMVATGQFLCRSAFYDRFTRALVSFMRQAVVMALETVYPAAPAFSGALSAFRDLMLIDATVIRLHELLKDAYGACRTNHTSAACKLHLVMSVLGKSAQKIRLTEERRRESRVLGIGAWVKGRLLLFDLGYFKYPLFDRISRFGGYFISRLKGLCNPTIVAENIPCRGRRCTLVGQKLKDLLPRLKRAIIDVTVEVRFARRSYRGKRTWVKKTFRVVGLYNRERNAYHLYITNISVEKLTAQQIAHIYQARWLIELIFKQLKSYYQLEALPSSKQEIIEALLLSAILTMMVSRTMQELLQQAEQDPGQDQAEIHFPLLRTAAVLSAFADILLRAVLKEAGCPEPEYDLFELIRKEAADPNRSRKLLLQRIHAI